ncbi:Uncharacterized protein dnm_057160 [Desulfonema magnum]|uniref:Uncharacterized protein n=1 Tax=Desulfonema magnum TaxID=45655 RepID=A0A975BPU9_9BACT|nr:Uncharacterized protein dnm_057160 [Desulfonema magnum]
MSVDRKFLDIRIFFEPMKTVKFYSINDFILLINKIPVVSQAE